MIGDRQGDARSLGDDSHEELPHQNKLSCGGRVFGYRDE